MEEAVSPEDRPGRQWSRSKATRRAILDAALDVFADDGYEKANIAHIVDRSGLSVGSVYHHFNGKSDLFLSLWNEYERANREASVLAVSAARSEGERRRVELFVIGARAYLARARADARSTLLFSGGEGPAGFDVLNQESGTRWLEDNLRLLRLPDDPANRLLARILTRAVSEGARAAAALGDSPEADAVVETTIEIARRIAG